MDIWDMRKVISGAKETLDNADRVVTSIAPLLVGRMKHVNCSTLAKIKRELKDFNAHTYTWKDK